MFRHLARIIERSAQPRWNRVRQRQDEPPVFDERQFLPDRSGVNQFDGSDRRYRGSARWLGLIEAVSFSELRRQQPLLEVGVVVGSPDERSKG